jgi:hypothetical protein
MRYAARLLLLTSLFSSGCHTSSHVARVLYEGDLGLSIKKVTAGGVWSTGESGHGLQIYVWAESEEGQYEGNLDLELDGAARVCAALAKSDRILEWAYIDVYYFNRYQNMVGAQHEVNGVAEVIVRRETLVMLRDQHAPASEFQKHWRFIAGHKDQPDSKSSLSW